MTGSILTLNAGSSSLNFALFDDACQAAVRGGIEDLGGVPHLLARDTGGAALAEQRWAAGQEHPFTVALGMLLALTDPKLPQTQDYICGRFG